jgi:hypothetical protein
MARTPALLRPDQRFSFSGNLLIESSDDETVLLNLDTDDLFGLNETGTFLAKFIQDNLTFKEMCETFDNMFSADIDMIEKEVSEILTDLIERNLIAAQ